jgi:glycosyltransferase involved in cell wall biosynthesis
MIGIYTKYRKYDSTLAVLALARSLELQGRHISINAHEWREANVDTLFDNRVTQRSFQAWLPKLRHIVWAFPGEISQIDAARKLGIRSTLYTSWDQLVPYDEKVLSSYSQVLLPTLVQAMKVRDKFGLKNVAVLPWYCHFPVTNKDSNTTVGKIRLFLSLYGNQRRHVDLASLGLLANVVRDFDKVEVTVAGSRGLSKYARKELRVYKKQLGTRFTVLDDCSWREQALLMGKHDLTVWPTLTDGFGLVGLTSLHMGTPVIAWDMNPINEHLALGRNAILVPGELDYNWLGVPRIKPDYAEFNRILRWLLDKPKELAELRRHTHERLAERKQEFEKGWEAILPTAL